MSTSVRARHGARGFSFVELLVTIVIAGIAFAAMVPLFVQAQQVSSGDKMRAIALNVAQDRVEKIRRLNFEVITPGNLASNAFYFGEFGSSWTEHTEGGGGKEFSVAYAVHDKQVSATDTRIAYKLVTVTVNWVGPPVPHKSVVLTTMIYRQYAGPELVDFFILPGDLVPTTADPNSEKMIVTSPVHMQATVDAGYLDSMAPTATGEVGRVDFLVTSVAGAASPTISVPYNGSSMYSATWPSVGTLPAGTADGYYTFKAVAFSALGSPGKSWELTYRIETGSPAAVTNLTGTAGLTSASLTWTASATGDVDHYLVKRNGVTLAPNPPAGKGSMGYTDNTALTAGATYVYTVYAVDWKGNESAAATKTLVASASNSPTPNPATNLEGVAMGSKARLTWAASTTPGVLGYVVYQTVNGNTVELITASATLDVAQGWNVTAIYQVKPYVAGNILSLSWATLLTGQPSQPVGGTPWLSMVIGAEVRYTLKIKNTTNKSLATLDLYYLGAAGTDPQQKMGATANNVAPNATAQWTDLAAGKYRWDWPGPGSSGMRSQTGWCSGATATILATVP